VLPGAGIRAHNVQQLVHATRCKQVHMTAFTAQVDPSAADSTLHFGSNPELRRSPYERVDCETVRQVKETLDAIVEKAE
jgi:copper homeostasis protein